jgi:uncharacterized membrane protein (DUF485 family)
MALLEDELKMIAESKRKRRIGRIVVFGFLSLLLMLTIVRFIVLIVFPHSWLAKHLLIGSIIKEAT